MSPHQHPAPARVGWGGGVGLDSSVNMPGSLLLGSGMGATGLSVGLPAHFGHVPVGSPFWRHICQGTSTPLTSAGTRKHRPGVICSGHLVGCPSPWGPVCLGHSGDHSSKPMAMSDAPQCSAGTCQHCWDPAVV